MLHKRHTLHSKALGNTLLGGLRLAWLLVGTLAVVVSVASIPARVEELHFRGAYAQEMRERGAFVAGEALLPTSAATTVRLRDGKTLTTHGPFAETAEQLGGYYLVECANLDEALEWAARNPAAAYGSVEVRPVMVFE